LLGDLSEVYKENIKGEGISIQKKKVNLSHTTQKDGF
jgi:hypothetical protein